MFDLVVIGSGPGGYVAAIKGAQLGGKVAVVEGNKLGGCCLNVGCIPTKALVHAATTYLSAKEAHKFGVEIGEVKLNLAGVMAHKSNTVKRLVDGLEMLLKGNGVTVYRGWANVPAPGKVEVTYDDGSKEVLETKNIVLATGSTQQLPPVPKESLAHAISSDDALELDKVPERMLIIGGGVIAAEFACIWNAFGSKVDMVKRSPLILPPVDEEISHKRPFGHLRERDARRKRRESPRSRDEGRRTEGVPRRCDPHSHGESTVLRRYRPGGPRCRA